MHAGEQSVYEFELGVASPDHRYVPVRVGEGVLVNEFGERGPSARLVLITWQCAAKFLQYSLLL
jgi:hypothetical protein